MVNYLIVRGEVFRRKVPEKMYKRISELLAVSAVLFSFHQTIIGQQDVFTWRNISTEKIYSKSVNDSFKIDIKLPDTYNDSTKEYPLLVVLDGDLLFPIAVGITHYLSTGGIIPEMIVVGIGY